MPNKPPVAQAPLTSKAKPSITTKKYPNPKGDKRSSGRVKKSQPKQPLPAEERLKRLFNSLCAQIDGGHFDNAIKTCDKILTISSTDVDALQTKLFLLLQTEQYVSALTLIDSQQTSQTSLFEFEKAYSLYRLHREDEVAELLDELKEKAKKQDKVADGEGEVDERGVMHLEAQLSYRRGDYQIAFDLYNELLDTAEPDTEEHSDILTNLEAAQRHLDFINATYLQALDTLPTSITSTLESTPPPAPPQSSFVLASKSTANAQEQPKLPAAATEKATEKTKKVRTKRVPTGVVPGVTPPPDPERWLKKSERSTFHTGHKRRKGGGGGGATQGTMEAPTNISAGGGTSGGAGGGKGKGRKKK